MLLILAPQATGVTHGVDEFALWFHLDDVYWSKAGRQSIDTILIAGAPGSMA